MTIDLSNPLVLMGASALPAIMFWLGVIGEGTKTDWLLGFGGLVTVATIICWIVAFCQMAQPYLP